MWMGFEKSDGNLEGAVPEHWSAPGSQPLDKSARGQNSRPLRPPEAFKLAAVERKVGLDDAVPRHGRSWLERDPEDVRMRVGRRQTDVLRQRQCMLGSDQAARGMETLGKGTHRFLLGRAAIRLEVELPDLDRTLGPAYGALKESDPLVRRRPRRPSTRLMVGLLGSRAGLGGKTDRRGLAVFGGRRRRWGRRLGWSSWGRWATIGSVLLDGGRDALSSLLEERHRARSTRKKGKKGW